MTLSEQTDAVLEDILNYLNFLSEIGITGFDSIKKKPSRIEKAELRAASAEDSLEKIRAEVSECRKCRLHIGRQNVVFGKGNNRAKLVFIGGFPVEDEEQKAELFVGEAGELLTKIIHAMHLTRDDVYISSLIKCRPPENRDPLPDEIDLCKAYLNRELKVIRPEYACTLGDLAARSILQTEKPVSQLRGEFYTVSGISVIPTYHPATLLQNPHMKRDVWEDIKKLMNAYGLPNP